MNETTATTTSAAGAADMRQFMERHRITLTYLSLAAACFLLMALKGV